MSSLFKKHFYLNKNIEYLISNEIIEYDIKSAGFNLIKKFNLLDSSKINYLETLDRKQKQVQIGLYMKNDKELFKRLNEKFIEVREWFFNNNNLKDDDILSIKKDAIIVTKRCIVTELDNISFIEKNIYTSYYYLNENEFYYNNTTIDVKGISDTTLECHRQYMLDFLHTFFKMNEISKRKRVIEFLKDFIDYYKRRKLCIEYYRELNTQSLFRLNDLKYNKEIIGVKDTAYVNDININYNFIHYLVPLISILI